jgi:hypothetical protein
MASQREVFSLQNLTGLRHEYLSVWIAELLLLVTSSSSSIFYFRLQTLCKGIPHLPCPIVRLLGFSSYYWRRVATWAQMTPLATGHGRSVLFRRIEYFGIQRRNNQSSAFHLILRWFLARLILRSQKLRQYVPLKRRTTRRYIPEKVVP